MLCLLSVLKIVILMLLLICLMYSHLKWVWAENETTVNLKRASFIIIMLLLEGLTHIHSWKQPKLHFVESFTLTHVILGKYHGGGVIGPRHFPTQSDALSIFTWHFLFTGKLNMTTLSSIIFILTWTLLQKNDISLCFDYICHLIVNVSTACTFCTDMTMSVAL